MPDDTTPKDTPPHLLYSIKDQLDRIEELGQRILYETRAPGGEWLNQQQVAERMQCGIDCVRAAIRNAEQDGTMVIFGDMKLQPVGQGTKKPRYRIWVKAAAQGEADA